MFDVASALSKNSITSNIKQSKSNTAALSCLLLTLVVNLENIPKTKQKIPLQNNEIHKKFIRFIEKLINIFKSSIIYISLTRLAVNH